MLRRQYSAGCSRQMTKYVVVINQFALPRSEGGGTRHVDLFSRLVDWTPLIIAGFRNHYTQERFRTTDRRFVLLPVPAHDGRSLGRFIGWLAYSLQAFVVTVTRPRLNLVYGSTPQPFGALAGLLAARLRRVPFVLEVRDLWPESIIAAGKLSDSSLPSVLLRAVEHVLAGRADRIICVTEGWSGRFSRLGIVPGKLVVIPNGSDPDDSLDDIPREKLRELHKVHGFTAVFAGAHGEKDGLNFILDAAKALPDVNFLLIGAGPKKRLAAEQARREGLKNVDFRDPIPKNDLPELLHACDVGLHAVSPLPVFQYGMSPNKIFDYMAAGLPVVSNAEGPLRKILADGECGRLGGPNSLAFCIEAVRSAGDGERSRWSRRSFEIVSQRYSSSRAAATLAGALDAVCQDAEKE
jgi:glycosyltransferase involved in cell wall biosynthesis